MASMPGNVIPMLAKLAADLPPDDERWAYEMKWDGIRALAYIEPDSVRLLTRNQNDVSGRFSELTALGSSLGRRDVILDGEVVAFDEQGRTSFQLLQQQVKSGVAVVYMLFDVLWLDGQSLMPRPYLERREQLDKLGLDSEHWKTPPFSAGGGAHLFETSRKLGMEGVVAKRLNSAYEPGKRTGAWLKIKNHQRQEFVIGGWEEGEGRRRGTIGALLIGYYEAGQLVYAGRVGTGFTDASLADLLRRLEPLRRETSPFTSGKPPRNVRYVAPELVGEVEFTEWTADRQIRHPSFKGLRTDKPAPEVVREVPS
jgi:bifunctional non-homologous end joining protein LigD